MTDMTTGRFSQDEVDAWASANRPLPYVVIPTAGAGVPQLTDTELIRRGEQAGKVLALWTALGRVSAHPTMSDDDLDEVWADMIEEVQTLARTARAGT